MTSSLVGSEMCIRDRCLPGDDDAAPIPLSRIWLGSGILQAALTMLEPVSYTHLTLPTICSV
eukprot:2227672-Prorocentrum_lima.AAC.1